jgi:8-oxo-dGTP diphosphatase
MHDEQQMPILAASACVMREGRVLMVRSYEELWAFPGGKVETGETIVEAATRELFEETGVTADLHTLVGQFDVCSKTGQNYTIVCLLGTWLSGEGVAHSDALEAKWVPADNPKKLKLAQHMAVALEMACNLQKV